MIDDWDLGRFTQRARARERALSSSPSSLDTQTLHAQPRNPQNQQSFIGLFVMLLLVVYHYAVAEDAAPAHRNQ